MKLSKKLSITEISKPNNIVAIIDEQGKVLGSDKSVVNLIKFYMTAPLFPAPLEDKERIGVKMIAPENEGQLIEVLEENLPDFGYKL